ncbi:MAG: metal ABC transporter ATP-binding protein [Alphaproteobacteria bacterium]|nr:metal ABC transporter ATP-binding protein [Alphaproteobacteria bacterium]
MAEQAARNASPGAVLIEAEGVAVAFDGRPVLTGVALSVRSHEIVSLIGPNGAGKTTLLRVMLGLLRPDRGEVRRRRGLRIGYMPQKLALDRTLPLSVARFLRLTRTPRGEPGEAAIRAALGEVGAAHIFGLPMQALSGGETQRALLARALLGEPELLVLDEPVQGVDVTGRAQLFELIASIARQRGCGVMLVSHDLHFVMAATDRVVCLNHHVCCTGHPEQVSRDPAFLGLFGEAARPALAVYTHHHDHVHSDDGGVLPIEGETGHSHHGHDHGHGHDGHDHHHHHRHG